MSLKSVAIVAVVVFLGGCSYLSSKQGSGGKVTVNWYCVSDLATDEKTCQKRRMRNGKPVDDEILDTIVIPGDQQLPPVSETQSLHNPPANAGDAVPWSRQPLSTVNTVEGPSSLQVENLGPEPRQTRATVDIWGKKGSGKSAEQVTEPAPTVATAEVDSPAKGGSGYTLQSAAFTSTDRCDTFLARHKLDNLSAYQKTISIQDTRWCIVTYGDYATESEAIAASKALAQANPKMTFWVRSWRAIEAQAVH